MDVEPDQQIEAEPIDREEVDVDQGDGDATDGTPGGPAPVGDAVPSPEEQRHLALRTDLAGLRTQMQGFQQLVDRLHTENEELRRGQLDRLLEPLFRDLMKLADDWRRMTSSWESGRDPARPEDVAGLCRAMVEDVDIILDRHGVEPATPDIGSAFDRREQRAVGTTPVADPGLDSTVSGVSRPGYRLGNRILRFPEVLVHRFTASEPG